MNDKEIFWLTIVVVWAFVCLGLGIALGRYLKRNRR